LPVFGLPVTSVPPVRTCTLNELAARVPPSPLSTAVTMLSVGATSLAVTVHDGVTPTCIVTFPFAAHAPVTVNV
jgi:hypothetical protein